MELEELRQRIDELDDELFDVIARRLSLMPMVADAKRSRNVMVDQRGREREVVGRIRKKAEDNGLDPDFAERIIEEIIEESKKIQKRSMCVK